MTYIESLNVRIPTLAHLLRVCWVGVTFNPFRSSLLFPLNIFFGSGMFEISSCVNTLLKYSFDNFAFSWFPTNSTPFDLSMVPLYPLSSAFLLMYA